MFSLFWLSFWASVFALLQKYIFLYLLPRDQSGAFVFLMSFVAFAEILTQRGQVIEVFEAFKSRAIRSSLGKSELPKVLNRLMLGRMKVFAILAVVFGFLWLVDTISLYELISLFFLSILAIGQRLYVKDTMQGLGQHRRFYFLCCVQSAIAVCLLYGLFHFNLVATISEMPSIPGQATAVISTGLAITFVILLSGSFRPGAGMSTSRMLTTKAERSSFSAGQILDFLTGTMPVIWLIGFFGDHGAVAGFAVATTVTQLIINFGSPLTRLESKFSQAAVDRSITSVRSGTYNEAIAKLQSIWVLSLAVFGLFYWAEIAAHVPAFEQYRELNHLLFVLLIWGHVKSLGVLMTPVIFECRAHWIFLRRGVLTAVLQVVAFGGIKWAYPESDLGIVGAVTLLLSNLIANITIIFFVKFLRRRFLKTYSILIAYSVFALLTAEYVRGLGLEEISFVMLTLAFVGLGGLLGFLEFRNMSLFLDALRLK